MDKSFSKSLKNIMSILDLNCNDEKVSLENFKSKVLSYNQFLFNTGKIRKNDIIVITPLIEKAIILSEFLNLEYYEIDYLEYEKEINPTHINPNNIFRCTFSKYLIGNDYEVNDYFKKKLHIETSHEVNCLSEIPPQYIKYISIEKMVEDRLKEYYKIKFISADYKEHYLHNNFIYKVV